MLIEFTFGNFRSFKDHATLSMVAASKLHADVTLDEANVFRVRQKPPLDLLRLAALYGANASGKSNVALALTTCLNCIATSANVGFKFPGLTFLLDTAALQQPTFFEVRFLCEGKEFRYGFEILNLNNQPEFVSEWLYQLTSSLETMLFERTNEDVRRGKRFREGTPLIKDGKIRRKDALFLSMAAQLGDELSSKLVAWLSRSIEVVSGLNDESLRTSTINYWQEGRFREEIGWLMQQADTGVPELAVLEDDQLKNLSSVLNRGSDEATDGVVEPCMQMFRVLTSHPVFDSEGKQVYTTPFSMQLLESQGTQKLFAFAGPIFDTLSRGVVLFVDEMDARFHPLLTSAIIRLFQSKYSNPKNAQLVFITHDTNLLNPKQFRRDQINFVEKDRFGSSHLYSLADFNGVRKDADFEADYIDGRYGAIPFVGGLKYEPSLDESVCQAESCESVGLNREAGNAST